MSSETEDVEELRQLVEAAHDRIDTLEDRLEEAKSGSTDTDGSIGQTNPRDSAVLDQISIGEVVSLRDLQQLYRAHTDIRAKQTLKSRIKTLTNREFFEHAGPSRWRYTGGDGE